MLNWTRRTCNRFREERLLQVAGGLTFTTLLSVVPLLAVSFALFTRFPVFRQLQRAIHEQLLKSLLPADISRTVLKHLSQFAANANGLTLLGFLFVVASAVALLLTVENVLNRIWQVKQNRPFFKRVGMYLLLLALGPLGIGASLCTMTYLVAASADLLETLPPSYRFLLHLGPVLSGAVGLAALFYFVPNTHVRRREAILGGLLASIALDLGKRGFAIYLLQLPSYKTVYGAFAVVPMFLVWVYFSWLVTLTAAVIASSLGRPNAPAGRRLARA